jgi:hypothetical protein
MLKNHYNPAVVLTCEHCGKSYHPVVRREATSRFCSLQCNAKRKHVTPEMLRERFWARVKRPASGDGCWLWTGGRHGSKGYGKLSSGRNDWFFAHRYSFELKNGPIPAGKIICHTCDNPLCVNPDHLYAGTHADNARDTSVRYRKPTTLRPAAVDFIRAADMTALALSDIFGVSPHTIHLIRAGRTWKHHRPQSTENASL